MSTCINRFRLGMMLALCVVLFGCSATVEPKLSANEVDADPALASAEFLGVKFKSGRPSIGESFLGAANSPGIDQEKRLQIDADGLKTIPGVRVEIIGFTDDRECSGQECYELSLRRAKVVYDWFISHGVPKKNLAQSRSVWNRVA